MKSCFWVLLLLTFYSKVSVCDDVACAERQTQFGAVCVCNSSYCDTVERPPPLTGDRYYRYTTSSDRPGFHRTTGYFKQTLPDDISNNNNVSFIVNPSIKYQEILGFGGSFTDAAGIVVDSLLPNVQTSFIESYFGPDGIEYSMGRVGVGMTDFSTRYYTYNNFQNDEEMVNFTLVDEDYKYKIPLIQRAIKASPHKFRLTGCAFTSPSWIQTMNGAYHSGYISKNHFHAWAKYHIKFLDSYAKHNISFWALTGGNEVVSILPYPSFLPLETAAMPYHHMVWLRDHLAPQLAASNHSDVKFLIMDDMRLYAKFWMSRFSRDPAAYDLIDGLALHWYYDWFTNDSIADDIHHNYPGKLIIYTESSINMFFGGQSVELGSWPRAAFYAYNIIENLNHWASGYLDWNLALNTYGGPYFYGPLDASVITNTNGEEFYKNQMFYAMGHFSKFIPPGSRRVDVRSNQQKPPLIQEKVFQENILKRPFNRKGIVEDISKEHVEDTTTMTPETSTIFPFDLPVLPPKTVSCVATVNSDNSSSVIVYNGMDSDVKVTIEDTVSGYITATLPANSLNTFVYWPNNS